MREHVSTSRSEVKQRRCCRPVWLALIAACWLVAAAGVADENPTVAELESRLEAVSGHERLEILNELAYEASFVSVEQGLEYAGEALELARELGDLAGEAEALRNHAVANSVGGEHRRSLEWAEQARDAFEQIGDRRGVASSLNVIGVCHRMLNEYDDALSAYERSLAIDRELGNREGEARTLSNVGNVYYDRGDFARAFEVQSEVLAISREQGDESEIASSLNNTGIALYRLGRFDEALEHLLEALAIDDRLGNRHGIATCSVNIGNIFFELGQDERALSYFQRSLELNQEIGHRSGILGAHNNIGNVYQRMERYPEALAEYEQVLKLARASGSPVDASDALDNIGVVHRNMGRLNEALDYHRQALALRESSGVQKGVATSCQNIGKALTGLGRTAEALPYLERALAIGAEIGSRQLVEEVAEDLSELYAARGEFEQALASYRRSVEARDEIVNEESSRRIAELEARYQSEKREQEIALLQKENEIRGLEASRARLQTRLVLAGLALVLVLLTWLLRRYRSLFVFWKKRSFVGHYRIVDQLAAGGMGVVYRAENVLEGSRAVALKVIRDEQAADETVRKRFLHEAAVVDQLAHPHIVRVFERGEHDSRLFMAMELLEGPSLAEVIRHGSLLPLADCLHVMAQLAEVVSSIHAKGVVHRDLKPENVVLVEREGDSLFVKLLDFGLARTQSLTRLTETGMIVGTVGYLAPEQITSQRCTAAGDVYALGVIFYELLTSTRPFSGDTPAEVIRQILEAEPPAPASLRPEIGSDLDALVLAMMAKDPAARPTDAAVVERLAALLPDESD